MWNRPTFVAVGHGRIALWHRPPQRVIPHLPAAGCTRVVTLLSQREGAEELGALVAAAGVQWTWIPLVSGRPPGGKHNDPIRAALPALSRALDAGESILLHCSAGMHRTGMMAYALLRWRGLERDEAVALLELMRPATSRALSAEHFAWGDRQVGHARL